MSEAVPDDDQPGRDRPEAGPAPPPADAPRPDQSLLRRLLAPSSRALIVMGPVYMLLGWVTLVAFCLLLSTATDGLRPEDLATRVPWGEMFAPLWMRDAAGLAFTLHLLRYRGIGVRAKVTAVESLLNVALSVWFKLAALRRLRVGTGSVRLVCLPIYLSMLVSIFARAVKSAATRPEQRATSNVSMGIGVTHILAITVACKLDGVSSYPSMSWTDTLWPLWLGLGALGVGVVMLACCFAPFLVCFSAAEQRGPTERVLGPTMVVVTLLALLGWACALVGSMNIALWLDGARARRRPNKRAPPLRAAHPPPAPPRRRVWPARAEAPDALPTRESLRLLSAAALCALLTGSCLAVIVLLQYQHPTDEDALGDEPAVSLEEMMSRAVKPKYLVRAGARLPPPPASSPPPRAAGHRGGPRSRGLPCLRACAAPRRARCGTARRSTSGRRGRSCSRSPPPARPTRPRPTRRARSRRVARRRPAGAAAAWTRTSSPPTEPSTSPTRRAATRTCAGSASRGRARRSSSSAATPASATRAPRSAGARSAGTAVRCAGSPSRRSCASPPPPEQPTGSSSSTCSAERAARVCAVWRGRGRRGGQSVSGASP